MNAEPTRKAPEPALNGQTNPDPTCAPEYDFRGGVRGKYAHRLAGRIQRDMVPEHAREKWDVEVAAYGELISRPRTQIETEED